MEISFKQYFRLGFNCGQSTRQQIAKEVPFPTKYKKNKE